MPIINVKISGAEDAMLAASVASLISALAQDHLNKKRPVTAVTLTFIPSRLWFIAGQSLEEQNARSFYVDIKVTESTNLKEQKAAFIRAVHAQMTALLGEVHPASYVYVEEVKADAYGYGGLTMEHRYVNQ